MSRLETIEELASQVKHLTAPLLPSRRAPSKVAVDPFEASMLRLQDLIARLQSEMATFRGALDRVSREELHCDLPKSDFLRMSELTDRTCESSGYSLADLRSPSRTAGLVRMRHATMRALRAEGFTFSAIGLFLNRDHGTVILAVKKGERP